MDRIYVALDLETTGLQSERDAIIEIGVVKFRGDEVLETWSSLVNPQRAIPPQIIQLTGITQAEVNQAPILYSVINLLKSFVKDYPIVGHNVSFDLGFLKRHDLFLDNPTIDTFELAGILLPHAARYSLGILADALGITFPTRHRALDDALATKHLFLGLLQQASQLDLSVIREINRLAARSDWSLKSVFQDLERDKARFAFTGSIGQQLMAKGALDGEGSLGLLFARQREKEKPLQPKAERQLLDVGSLAAMLEEGGEFSREFPGYEYRPQQVEMLRAIAEAFNRRRHLLAEAGTGTGKSIAYLLPAAYFAVQNGERVVISTNTINLQDQLFLKDIPDLQKILPFEFKTVLLKGRSNYICLRRLAVLRHAGNLSMDELRVLAKILVWLPSTMTGDQAELFMPTLEERFVWSRICSDSENCLAERCTFRQEDKCFFYRARQQAEGAHLVIVNHALLLSDVAMENRVLPEYRYLIVDEAHHLEDATTHQLSFEVNLRSVQRLLSDLSQRPGPRRYAGYLAEVMARCRGSVPGAIERELESYIENLHQEVEAAGHSLYEFFNTLSLFLKEHSRPGSEYDQTIRLTSGLRIQPAWADVEIAGDNFSVHLFKLGDGLKRLYSGLGDLEDYDIPGYEDLVQGLLGYHQRLEDLRRQLNALIAQPSPGEIYWAEISAKDQEISLHAAPLHIGHLVERHLLQPKECVVLTSATLCTDGDFSFIKERLNAWEVADLAVGSPFDYVNSTLLYLVNDIPEPNQPHYQKAVEQALTALCQATRGRTLVLFTSYSQLRSTSRAVTRPLAENDIVVFQQGDGSSRRQLLENFRSMPRSVLLGTRSFWEGVDVMGEALSCLVITRLPFSVPTDPIFAARCEAFEDSFGQYAVPETILRFRQGFGRLIRSKADRGVVVILDRRVLTKSYGQAFLNSLPECTVKRGSLVDLPAEAARWIDGEVSYQTGLGL